MYFKIFNMHTSAAYIVPAICSCVVLCWRRGGFAFVLVLTASLPGELMKGVDLLQYLLDSQRCRATSILTHVPSRIITLDVARPDRDHSLAVRSRLREQKQLRFFRAFVPVYPWQDRCCPARPPWS